MDSLHFISLLFDLFNDNRYGSRGHDSAKNKTMLLKDVDVGKGIRFLLIKYTNQSMRNRYVDDRHSKQFLTTRYQPLLMMLDVAGRRWLWNTLIVFLSGGWRRGGCGRPSLLPDYTEQSSGTWDCRYHHNVRRFHILIVVKEEIANDDWGNGQMPSWHWVQGRCSINPWSTYASIYN